MILILFAALVIYGLIHREPERRTTPEEDAATMQRIEQWIKEDRQEKARLHEIQAAKYRAKKLEEANRLEAELKAQVNDICRDSLVKLRELYECGELSKEQYEEAVDDILDSMER